MFGTAAHFVTQFGDRSYFDLCVIHFVDKLCRFTWNALRDRCVIEVTEEAHISSDKCFYTVDIPRFIL